MIECKIQTNIIKNIENDDILLLIGATQVGKTTIVKYLYILQKSYIIKLCRPFFRNVRKELVKMPKVFFIDAGYRNSLLDLFEPLTGRGDAGQTLENIFFIELIKLKIENIKFWRTQYRHEIDFIIDDKYAFEVKMNLKSFKKNKYKSFTENYPDIVFNALTYKDDTEPDIFDFAS